MSQLQKEAMPLLIKLINDEWLSISAPDRSKLNKWAAMLTMVYEFADPDTAAISFEERHAFAFQEAFPEGWQCLLSRYGGSLKEPKFWHTGARRVDLTGRSGIQQTTFTFGKALLQTFSCKSDIGRLHVRQLDHTRMIQLYPESRFVKQRPINPLSDQDTANAFRSLRDAVVAIVEKRQLRPGEGI